MTTDPVLRARRGAVEIVTINRPEARNAINEDDAAAEVFRSPDAIEGATAYAEKRMPNWTGHLRAP